MAGAANYRRCFGSTACRSGVCVAFGGSNHRFGVSCREYSFFFGSTIPARAAIDCELEPVVLNEPYMLRVSHVPSLFGSSSLTLWYVAVAVTVTVTVL